MKKTFALLAAAILTLGLFALAACNDEPENNSQTGGEGETAKTVTAEEWTAAFATVNFTNSTIQGSSTISQGEISETSTTEWEMDGDKIKETNSVVDGANGADYITYYYEKTDNDYNMYVQSETGEWTTRPIGQATSPLEDILEYFNVAKNAYTSVSFDEQKDGYYASTYMTELAGTSTVLTDLLVKFSDKKITGISYSAVSDDITMALSFTVSAYGTTSVTLPTVTPQKMPESEWNAAFADDVFDNYTVTSSDAGAVVSVSEYVNDGETTLVHQTSGGAKYYFEVTPDATYQYTQENGEWIKSVNEEFYIDMSLFEAMAAGYENAVYDAENDIYTLTDVQAGTLTYESIVIKFANGKIAEMVSTMINDGVSITRTAEFSDYGTTSVTLPTVKTFEKMTEAQWRAAFDADNLINFTFESESADGYYLTEACMDGTTELVHSITPIGTTDWETYRETAGDVQYLYYKNENDQWVKEVNTSFNWTDTTFFKRMAELYDDVVFDEELNVYTLEEIPYSQQNPEAGTIAFENGHVTEIKMESITIRYSNYGTTSVTLPTTYIDETTAK